MKYWIRNARLLPFGGQSERFGRGGTFRTGGASVKPRTITDENENPGEPASRRGAGFVSGSDSGT